MEEGKFDDFVRVGRDGPRGKRRNKRRGKGGKKDVFTEDRPPFYFFLSRRFFPSTHPHLSLSSFKLDFPTGIFKDFVHGRKRKGRRSVKSNSANIREYLPWKKTFVLRNLSLERQHSFSIIGPEFIEKVGRNQEGKKLRPRFSLNRLVNVRNVYSPFSLFTPSYSLFLRGEFRICIPYDILPSYVISFSIRDPGKRRRRYCRNKEKFSEEIL